MAEKRARFNWSQPVNPRRFADADLVPFLPISHDPLVARYQSWESYTEQQAARQSKHQNS